MLYEYHGICSVLRKLSNENTANSGNAQRPLILRESRAREHNNMFLCVETLHGAPKLKIILIW